MIRSHVRLAAISIAASAVTLAAAAPKPETAQAAAAPPAAFAPCKTCHTVTKGGSAGVGPNLFGVIGSAAAAKPGYAYSSAMKNAKIRWTRASLDAFLANPSGLVAGTKMGLPGIKEADKRKAIVDYLATLK